MTERGRRARRFHLVLVHVPLLVRHAEEETTDLLENATVDGAGWRYRGVLSQELDRAEEKSAKPRGVHEAFTPRGVVRRSEYEHVAELPIEVSMSGVTTGSCLGSGLTHVRCRECW